MRKEFGYPPKEVRPIPSKTYFFAAPGTHNQRQNPQDALIEQALRMAKRGQEKGMLS